MREQSKEEPVFTGKPRGASETKVSGNMAFTEYLAWLKPLSVCSSIHSRVWTVSESTDIQCFQNAFRRRAVCPCYAVRRSCHRE